MKILNNFFAFTVAILLLVSFASSLSLSFSNNIAIGKNATMSLSSSNTNNQIVTFSVPNAASFPGIALNLPASAVINTSQSLSLNSFITLSTPVSNIKVGTYAFNVLASGNNSENVTTTLNFVRGTCSSGFSGGNLSIRNVDISNTGDKDEEWLPLDVITVEVDVENNGKADIDNVFVEIGLFDSSGNEYTGDLDFISADEEEYEIGDINDGDKETATFEFKVPADFDFDLGDLKLEVKAYSDDLGEAKECIDSSVESEASVSIKVNNQDESGKAIAFDSLEFSPEQATCGSLVTLSGEVFNVGDQGEDRVKIYLKNSQLGIDLSSEVKSLDQFDGKDFSFNFNVPQTARNSQYTFGLTADYDYGNGRYRDESEDPTLVDFTVFGCTVTGSSGVSVSLPSSSVEVEAGDSLTVPVKITNTLNTQATYTLTARGFSEWAESDTSSRTISLNAGESRDVSLVLDTNDDASGAKTLTLEVSSSASDSIETKTLSVNFPESSSGLGSNGIFSGPLIWIIAGVNILLILIIIIVAVRMSR